MDPLNNITFVFSIVLYDNNMNIILDYTQDFWELNPNLRSIFGPNLPDSNHMWAVAYFVHPESDLAFYDSPRRIELLKKNVLKDPSFDWETLTDLLNLFEEGVLTRTQKHVLLWRKKLEERDDLLRKTPYTLQTKDDLDKMLKESRYLWPQLEEAEQKLFKDTMSSQVEGGGEESLSDKNLL